MLVRKTILKKSEFLGSRRNLLESFRLNGPERLSDLRG